MCWPITALRVPSTPPSTLVKAGALSTYLTKPPIGDRRVFPPDPLDRGAGGIPRSPAGTGPLPPGRPVVRTPPPGFSRRKPDHAGASSRLISGLLPSPPSSSFPPPLIHRGRAGTGNGRLVAPVPSTTLSRRDPFVVVNCAPPSGAPPGVGSSSWHGRRGASAAPTGRTPGLFQAAHGGTLFLDEVGESPHHSTAEAPQGAGERRGAPGGIHRSRTVDVRVVTATNRDVEQEVEQRSLPGGSVLAPEQWVHLHVPALRERPCRHPALLAEYFPGTPSHHPESDGGSSPPIHGREMPGELPKCAGAGRHPVRHGGHRGSERI